MLFVAESILFWHFISLEELANPFYCGGHWMAIAKVNGQEILSTIN
jgi:hypothetical protein